MLSENGTPTNSDSENLSILRKMRTSLLDASDMITLKFTGSSSLELLMVFDRPPTA